MHYNANDPVYGPPAIDVLKHPHRLYQVFVFSDYCFGELGYRVSHCISVAKPRLPGEREALRQSFSLRSSDGFRTGPVFKFQMLNITVHTNIYIGVLYGIISEVGDSCHNHSLQPL